MAPTGNVPGILEQFSTLQAPALTAMAGTHHGELIGGGLTQTAALVMQAPTAIRGWCGKRFDTDGQGMNLVRRGGQIAESAPIQLVTDDSHIDGRSVLRVVYSSGALRLLCDELRQLDPDTVLGIGMLNLAGRWIPAFPFLLHRQA
ncbi:MAG: hypothetical protein GYB64_11295 [Chloroflexi bacterium]|nr:hypothetical protein [Chloroflexota bacterium]